MSLIHLKCTFDKLFNIFTMYWSIFSCLQYHYYGILYSMTACNIESTLLQTTFPFHHIITYNKQGSFQMITKDYSKGPRVVRKDYVLWKVKNMQESVSMPSPSGQSQFPIRSLWLWNSNQINLFVDNPYCLWKYSRRNISTYWIWKISVFVSASFINYIINLKH